MTPSPRLSQLDFVIGLFCASSVSRLVPSIKGLRISGFLKHSTYQYMLYCSEEKIPPFIAAILVAVFTFGHPLGWVGVKKRHLMMKYPTMKWISMPISNPKKNSSKNLLQTFKKRKKKIGEGQKVWFLILRKSEILVSTLD